ncbi:MAG TPA: HEAT repeat domain-containing protein [Chthonomonadaceae bacterium]|nr:HEAT repeat domain-containing protein [Chthonomonadaceae bacterium]
MVVSSVMEEAAEPTQRWLRRWKAHLDPHLPARVCRHIERLNSVSRNERIEAATLLGEINDRRAVPALIRAIARHPNDPLFLQAAVEALGHLGDPRALPALYPLTTGHSYSLMQAARLVVASLEPKAVLLRAGTASPTETGTLLRPHSLSHMDPPTGLLRAYEETRP